MSLKKQLFCLVKLMNHSQLLRSERRDWSWVLCSKICHDGGGGGGEGGTIVFFKFNLIWNLLGHKCLAQITERWLILRKFSRNLIVKRVGPQSCGAVSLGEKRQVQRGLHCSQQCAQHLNQFPINNSRTREGGTMQPVYLLINQINRQKSLHLNYYREMLYKIELIWQVEMFVNLGMSKKYCNF
jgi:hypothetical protein